MGLRGPAVSGKITTLHSYFAPCAMASPPKVRPSENATPAASPNPRSVKVPASPLLRERGELSEEAGAEKIGESSRKRANGPEATGRSRSADSPDQMATMMSMLREVIIGQKENKEETRVQMRELSEETKATGTKMRELNDSVQHSIQKLDESFSKKMKEVKEEVAEVGHRVGGLEGRTAKGEEEMAEMKKEQGRIGQELKEMREKMESGGGGVGAARQQTARTLDPCIVVIKGFPYNSRRETILRHVKEITGAERAGAKEVWAPRIEGSIAKARFDDASKAKNFIIKNKEGWPIPNTIPPRRMIPVREKTSEELDLARILRQASEVTKEALGTQRQEEVKTCRLGARIYVGDDCVAWKDTSGTISWTKAAERILNLRAGELEERAKEKEKERRRMTEPEGADSMDL